MTIRLIPGAGFVDDALGSGFVPGVGFYSVETSSPSPSPSPTSQTVPGGNITSFTVSGQDVTISGTTTGTPTSGLASLTASGNGAISRGPQIITLGTNTFTVTFLEVASGNYLAPTVTLTNTNGTSSATGGSAFSIIGIAGEGEGSDLARLSTTLRNNTGTVLKNVSNITVHVYELTGPLVFTSTGVSSDPNGYVILAHASLVSGTSYRMVLIFNNGDEGLSKLTAS